MFSLLSLPPSLSPSLQASYPTETEGIQILYWPESSTLYEGINVTNFARIESQEGIGIPKANLQAHTTYFAVVRLYASRATGERCYSEPSSPQLNFTTDPAGWLAFLRLHTFTRLSPLVHVLSG